MRFFIILVFTMAFFPSITDAQAGIYSETDIDYQSLFFDAELAKQQGKTEDQIDFLREMLKRKKDDHAVYFELAKAYQIIDNNELAQKNIEKAIDLNPSNEWYLLIGAQILEKGKQYNKATSYYQSLLQINPKNLAIYHQLALTQLNNKKPTEAAATLENCIVRNGIDEDTARRLFDIYRNSNRKDQARNTLERLCESSPDNTRYMNNLAGFLNDIGETKEAEKIYHQVLELDPSNGPASMALVKEKTVKSKAGDYLSSLIPVMQNMNIPLDNKIKELMPYISTMSKNGAETPALIEISELLVDAYPADAKVYAIQGDVAFYTGNYIGAEKAYEKSISINDRQYILWDQWMVSLWEREDYQKLEKVSFDAVDLFPNEASAYIIRSLCLEKTGNIDESMEYADEANFIAANSQRFKFPLVILNTWLKRNDLSKDEIKDALSRIKLNDIQSHIYMELLGDLNNITGNKEVARKMWEKAVELGADPDRIHRKTGA
ncbi:MAG: tetratricopeptide repeat protein [Saprospiraceae bacterium]|nr:tetratricopeptide repeat protein [Bacteroidia bacterium]MBT8230631.1 tetratricopeptide repeat protein [Bacteroidia bacterium]NNF20804.1 tetratricopeptide repeat protein [Saprospiraceae bacterium]NNK89560.1 tetratricopeptide repeat protein [Saprospiraceae bacterium]